MNNLDLNRRIITGKTLPEELSSEAGSRESKISME